MKLSSFSFSIGCLLLLGLPTALAAECQLVDTSPAVEDCKSLAYVEELIALQKDLTVWLRSFNTNACTPTANWTTRARNKIGAQWQGSVEPFFQELDRLEQARSEMAGLLDFSPWKNFIDWISNAFSTKEGRVWRQDVQRLKLGLEDLKYEITTARANCRAIDDENLYAYNFQYANLEHDPDLPIQKSLVDWLQFFNKKLQIITVAGTTEPLAADLYCGQYLRDYYDSVRACQQTGSVDLNGMWERLKKSLQTFKNLKNKIRFDLSGAKTTDEIATEMLNELSGYFPDLTSEQNYPPENRYQYRPPVNNPREEMARLLNSSQLGSGRAAQLRNQIGLIYNADNAVALDTLRTALQRTYDDLMRLAASSLTIGELSYKYCQKSTCLPCSNPAK